MRYQNIHGVGDPTLEEIGDCIFDSRQHCSFLGVIFQLNIIITQTQLPELQELGTLERLREHVGCHFVCTKMANGDRSVVQVVVNPKVSNFDMARSLLQDRPVFANSPYTQI